VPVNYDIGEGEGEKKAECSRHPSPRRTQGPRAEDTERGKSCRGERSPLCSNPQNKKRDPIKKGKKEGRDSQHNTEEKKDKQIKVKRFAGGERGGPDWPHRGERENPTEQGDLQEDVAISLSEKKDHIVGRGGGRPHHNSNTG